MKKLAAFIAVAAFAVPAFAETITGDAQCAKCSLKTADACQLAIKVGDEMILVENNDVAKGFQKKVCQDTVKVVAEGKIALGKDGSKLMTLTKVEEKK